MPVDPHQLAQVVTRLSRRLRQERQSDLTPTQLSVLGTIFQIGPATPSAIAAHERVRPPSVTRTLACLVEHGLVDRGQDPGDGRQVLVAISSSGRSVLAAERERRDEWLRARLDRLDEADRDLLADAAQVLERLVGY